VVVVGLALADAMSAGVLSCAVWSRAQQPAGQDTLLVRVKDDLVALDSVGEQHYGPVLLICSHTMDIGEVALCVLTGPIRSVVDGRSCSGDRRP